MVAIAAFFMACSNPAGPNGNRVDNIQRPATPGGGDEGNGLPPTSGPGWLRAVGDDVLEQLEWLRDYSGIRNDGYYYVVAGDNERPIPGSHNLGSVRESITVLIKSDDPANRRTLQLAEGNGAMLNVGAGNTLMLQDINLQGLGINIVQNFPLVNVSNGVMEMTNSEIKYNRARGVNVNNGKFTMGDGAVIRDNIGGSGGGVLLTNSTFTMSGNARIVGNHSQGAAGSRSGTGGGVHLSNSTLTMYDSAKISSNSTNGGSGMYSGSGGGVALLNNSVLNMHGNNAHISGNVAHNTSSNTASGGGVFIDGSTLNISGGRIQGSSASPDFQANTATGSGAAVTRLSNATANIVNSNGVFLQTIDSIQWGSSSFLRYVTNYTIIVSNNGNSVVLQP